MAKKESLHPFYKVHPLIPPLKLDKWLHSTKVLCSLNRNSLYANDSELSRPTTGDYAVNELGKWQHITQIR